ncbi:MAG: SPOR domain-containing protein [Mariprofundaceae bacterium]
MSKKLRTWVATPAETKAAWIIASICIVLVVGSFLWPLIDNNYSEKNTFVSKQKIMPETESIEKIIAKVQKGGTQAEKKRPQPTPALKKTAPETAKKNQPASKPITTSKILPNGYYVQLGAFKERKRAQTLQKKLAANWKTQLKEKSNNMIAVWAGPYKNSKEATRIKSEIITRTKIKGFIVKN